MSEYILTHKHHTHPHAASGWRIHCGVEVTELSTNKQHTFSPSVRVATQEQIHEPVELQNARSCCGHAVGDAND